MANVRWVEGHASVTDLLKNLATQITNNGVDTVWQLHYPATLDIIDRCFTLTKTSGTKTIYIEFYRPLLLDVITYSSTINDTQGLVETAVTQSKDNYFMMECKFGTEYLSPTVDGERGTWMEDTDSARSRFSWFKASTDSNIKAWLPIQYWLSIDDNKVAIILEGDPSANYKDRLISFGYFGRLKPFKEDVGTNEDVNFGLTVSSDTAPSEYLTELEMNQYSDKTGTGVTDINMLETYTGFPMQAHQASFTTPDEFTDKKLEGPSYYTKKYHMSPVYIFHGFDGYRGELYGVVVTDRSTVVNLDEMIYTYASVEGGTLDTQDVYKVFLVNSPYSLFNNSTNVLYGIAVLQEQRPYTP